MKRILCGIFVLTLLLASSVIVLAREYHYEETGNYIYHYFEFDEDEMATMAKSPHRAQKYANWMVNEIWDLADRMGSALGKFTGKVYLAFYLNSQAKEARKNMEDTLCIKIRSRSDKEGKWALEFLDKVAECWKKLTE